jgi:hypothetical protein
MDSGGEHAHGDARVREKHGTRLHRFVSNAPHFDAAPTRGDTGRDRRGRERRTANRPTRELRSRPAASV